MCLSEHSTLRIEGPQRGHKVVSVIIRHTTSDGALIVSVISIKGSVILITRSRPTGQIREANQHEFPCDPGESWCSASYIRFERSSTYLFSSHAVGNCCQISRSTFFPRSNSHHARRRGFDSRRGLQSFTAKLVFNQHRTDEWWKPEIRHQHCVCNQPGLLAFRQ